MAEDEKKVEETSENKFEEASENKIEEESDKKIEVEDKVEELKKAEGAPIGSSASFKEESNVVADLVDPQKKALDELKKLVEDALSKNEFSKPKEKKSDVEKTQREETAPARTEESAPPEKVYLWGVPLLGDERSDTILLKFLRARDFKVKEALEMIKSTSIWRKDFEIEKLLEEDLGLPELEKVVFMKGTDKEGHPVCYNVYGEFQDKVLYQNVFSDEEKRKKFLQWRILFLEKGIRELLDFSPGGVSSMVQVTDLKNSPTLGKREVRQTTNLALQLLQDNYPEFVAKQVAFFIYFPLTFFCKVDQLFYPSRSSLTCRGGTSPTTG